MFEDSITIGLALADRYGGVVLFVAFVLEGAVVGKVIPTRGLLVALVLATGLSLWSAATIAFAAVAGATVGQLVLFVLVRRAALDPAASPRVPITDTDVARATDWLDRWGPLSVAASNTLPVVRGTMTVPSAMGQVSVHRFSLYSIVGTTLYVGVLVGAAGLVGDVLSLDALTSLRYN